VQAPPVTLGQLTGLRFVAAFAVLLSHLEFLAAEPGSRAAWLYETVLRQGYCGVSFFYVLSGFILSQAYGDRLADGALRLRTYFLLRICRIAPLHWIMALLFAGWLAVSAGGMPGGGTIALNLALLHAWVPDPDVHYSLNGPSWSLSDEMFFYAAFPWLCRVRGRRLAWGLACGVLLIAALAAVSLAGPGGYSPQAEWLFYVAPPVRLVDFVAGMLLHRIWRAGSARRLGGTGAELGAALAIPAAMLGFSLLAVPMEVRWQLAWLPLMALAVLVFAQGTGALSHLLRGRWPMLLGEASFALYLTHRPLVTLASRLWTGDPVLLALALPPVCIGISIAVFLLFERPLLRRLQAGAWAYDRRKGGLKAWLLSWSRPGAAPS